MIDLLKNQLVAYINSKKTHLAAFDGVEISVKSELISDALFDIKDLMPTIKQPAGTGSATYRNVEEKNLLFVDYEDFINQLPEGHRKDIKKCDFIAFDQQRNTVFILNELSLSGSAKNKFSKAREQLRMTLFYLSAVPEIRLFMDAFPIKKCVFSNKSKVIESPNGMAASFEIIKQHLSDPVLHDFQPITKMGFEFIETAIVTV